MIGGVVAVPRGQQQVSGGNDLSQSGAICGPALHGENRVDCPTLVAKFEALCDGLNLSPEAAELANKIVRFARMGAAGDLTDWLRSDCLAVIDQFEATLAGGCQSSGAGSVTSGQKEAGR